MPNTPRTQSALLTLFADNNTGEISAQDIRDFTVSVYNNVDSPTLGTSASNLTTGTLPDARLGNNVALKNQDNAFSTGQTVTGTVTATLFSGSGASLTNLPAANITGTLPAISGANLTTLNATNLSSGTVANARLSAQVPLLTNSSNQFQNGSTGGTTLTIKGNGSNGATLQLHSGGSNGLTLLTDNAGNISHNSNRGFTCVFGADGGDYQIGGTGRDSTGGSINLFAGNCSSGASLGGAIQLIGGSSAEGTGGSIVLAPGTGDVASGIIELNGAVTVQAAATFQDTVQVNASLNCNGSINADGGTIQADILSSLSDVYVGANLVITGQLRPQFENTSLDVTANTRAIPIYDGEGSLVGYIGVFNAVW